MKQNFSTLVQKQRDDSVELTALYKKRFGFHKLSRLINSQNQ